VAEGVDVTLLEIAALLEIGSQGDLRGDHQLARCQLDPSSELPHILGERACLDWRPWSLGCPEAARLDNRAEELHKECQRINCSLLSHCLQRSIHKPIQEGLNRLLVLGLAHHP
jgi:hypothetical protein